MNAKQLAAFIAQQAAQPDPEIFEQAARQCRATFAGHVYLRGLIELSSHCKNDCYYCGIRKSNAKASRYRLDKAQILQCCQVGYALGYRTFVLQGGEDGYFDDEKMPRIVSAIRQRYPDCAITLSLGERSSNSYEALFAAGANRYLLRHETATATHYRHLHPPRLSWEHRKECLYQLKTIGYQVGAGFMVGSPGQSYEHLANDLLFLRELQPHMVGIGPFIPHADTPFAQEPSGPLQLTLLMIALTRLMLPEALLPATTALASLHKEGRAMGLQAGANVIMPNLSPPDTRTAYSLYNNKVHTDDEAAENLRRIQNDIHRWGLYADMGRGDHPQMRKPGI